MRIYRTHTHIQVMAWRRPDDRLLPEPAVTQRTYTSLGLNKLKSDYNMTVWVLARNDINFSMAAGLIRLHMPGVK